MSQTAIDHRGMNKVLGNVDQFPELAAIVGAIFSKVRYFTLPNGERVQVKVMAGGQCFAVDHQGRRYVEQNSTKGSPEAKRARHGARIVWVIQTHDRNNQPLNPNKWIGKIEDGLVRMR